MKFWQRNKYLCKSRISQKIIEYLYDIEFNVKSNTYQNLKGKNLNSRTSKCEYHGFQFGSNNWDA